MSARHAPNGDSSPPQARLTPAASGYLDAARGIAALAVLIGHARGFYFVEYGSVMVVSPAIKALYMLTGFGHQAVMVFFVLSGFFISSSVFHKLERNAWSWSRYAVDRGARLYLVLIPGLLLGLLWDSLGIRLLDRSGVYSNPMIPFGDRVPAHTLAPADFLGNLLFLQTRFAPAFGSNGPLWSLSNEFWYYVLFPASLMLILCVRRRALLSASGYGLLVIFTCWILGAQLGGFAVWLAGTGVALSARQPRHREWAQWTAWAFACVAIAAFGFCLWSARIGNARVNGRFGSDMAVGLSFAVLLHGMLQLPVSMPAAGLKLAKKLASFSFSLYVLHFPLLFLIRAKWLPEARWQPDLRHLIYGASICAGVLLYSYGIARVTEGKTPAVRAWLRREFLLPTAPLPSRLVNGL